MNPLQKPNKIPTLIENIMAPILSLFRFCGLYSKKQNKLYQVILAVLFNVAALGVITFKIFCVSRTLNWGTVFSAMIKLIPLILWWLVRLRMKKILFLVKKLDFFGEEIITRERNSKFSKMVTASALSMIFLQPMVRILIITIFPEEVAVCIYRELISIGKRNRVIIYTLDELFNRCPDTIIILAVVSFFTTYCYTLSVALKEKRCISKTQSFLVHEKPLQIFRELESVFSPLILLIFSHIVFDFLKTMFMIVITIKYHQSIFLPSECLKFLTDIMLMVATVLTADKVQLTANDYRKSLIAFCKTQDGISSNGEFASLHEDRESIRLTGWGMFIVRKPVLLSLSAWLFAYGVILLQFM
ncbi:uncharacterized protein TNIN_177671 [Trichonephila inaurata madagascariensis]|uniref:Uncharacterized protein n=1 Tax=Trichonephila inaurata madagascariensis TaxID=2747483 RepID=A0A8X6X8P8_9ARAC|nr:uncharacterized protein TNIN_177671 [Trichonephila inaurata madagascariensis]